MLKKKERVIFARPEGTDIYPPDVLSIRFDKKISSNIEIVFDEKMKSTSLSPNTVKIEGSKSGLHEYDHFLSKDGTIFTINPKEDFAYNEDVHITFSSFIQDFYGNRLTSATGADLSTEVGMTQLFGGNVKPTLASSDDYFYFEVYFISPEKLGLPKTN